MQRYRDKVNMWTNKGDHWELLIVRDNTIVLVDSDDQKTCSKYTWTTSKAFEKYPYVLTFILTKNKWHSVPMHRIIMSEKSDIDHINHNVCDNRRQNLRVCNKINNCHNRRKRIHKNGISTKSKYKGVTQSNSKKWVARIVVGKERLWIGSFEEEIEAAKAYYSAAVKYYKEFAMTNKMLGLL